MRIPYYQVDAFATGPFTGNPAGVCLLEEPLDTPLMQRIAQEMNLSETAFVYPIAGESLQTSETFGLRWFSPETEMPLCGHATLGATHALYDAFSLCRDRLFFETQRGILTVGKCPEGYMMDLPADEPLPSEMPDGLCEAMGIAAPVNIFRGRHTGKLVIHVASPAEVTALTPDFLKMKTIQPETMKGVGVTSKGAGNDDIISRYFNPWAGVPEDPVTGSVHALLAPYWHEILGKTRICAFQASARGGKLLLSVGENGRVEMAGASFIALEGMLHVHTKTCQ